MDKRAEYRKAWKAANPEKVRAYAFRYYQNNREKSLERAAGFAKAHPDRVREYNRRRDLKRQYGITAADYDAMFARQGGVCKGCGQPETAVYRGRVVRLSVDHNHTTGLVRGLLCGRCNHTLGWAAEDPTRLRGLAAYIEADDLQKGSRTPKIEPCPITLP